MDNQQQRWIRLAEVLLGVLLDHQGHVFLARAGELVPEDGREHDASLVVHLTECISAESDHGFLGLN